MWKIQLQGRLSAPAPKAQAGAVLQFSPAVAGLLWTTLNVFHASWAQKAAEMGLCCVVRTLS